MSGKAIAAGRIGGRGAACRWSAALLAMVLTTSLAVTGESAVAVAQPGDLAGQANPRCPDGVGTAGEAVAPDERRAAQWASACGVEVEVAQARTYHGRTWARPDGTLRSEISAVPRWTRDNHGRWVNVDTSLIRDSEGSVRSAATVTGLRISGGGWDPFVTATDPGGGVLSLSWPTKLPTPSLDRNTATFGQVLKGVDLVVTAGANGFAYRLVVHSAEAAANPELARVEVGITGTGLDVVQAADGVVEARDTTGTLVFSSGPALMWDSSVAGPGTGAHERHANQQERRPGRVERLPVELDGGSLAVVPDADLLTGPDVEYPVFIDPPFHGDWLRWANVHWRQRDRGWTNDSQWPRAGGMRVGKCYDSVERPCLDAIGVWRSVVSFRVAPLGGRHILSAAVKMKQTHTGGCDPYPLRLWEVAPFDSGVSWDGVNWLNGGPLQSRNVPSSNPGCGQGDQDVSFNNSAVRAQVQSHADQGRDVIGFGVRSGSETNEDQWRRIRRDSLVLQVEHASYPRTPTNLSTDGEGCSSSGPGDWLTTGRPTLSGRPRNADGNGRYRLEVRRIGQSGNTYAHRSGTLTVNTTVSHRVPSSGALADGEYRWRMRTESAHSGVPPSSYSGWCYFRVDTTPPPEPSATQLTEDPRSGDPVEFRLAGSSDTNRFRYNVSGGSSTTVSASGGVATITVTPPTTSIDHQLQVWALDEAGNLSDRYDRWFTIGKDHHAPTAAVWRFAGDWRDDSGNDHTLAPVPSGSFTDDRQGRPTSAMALDGESCASTGSSVLKTDQSFTVAAWARPDDGGSSPVTILSQPGEENTAFRLRRWGNDDRWAFVMLDDDSVSATWYTLMSEQVATGGWQHVAGVFDAPASRMRLYVDGVLQGSTAAPAPWGASGRTFAGCASNGGDVGWDRFEGAVDDLVAYQGVLTGSELRDLMEYGPPAGEVSWWPTRGTGEDAGPAGHDLTVPPESTWVPDSHGRSDSAMQLVGESCASAENPVIRTDESFTVALWVRPGDEGDTRTRVMSQAGQHNTTFRLSRMEDQRWAFNLSGADEAEPEWYSVHAPAAAYTGGWQHLVGVYDARSGSIRLYVDGALEGEQDIPEPMWRAGGALYVGCAANTGGTWEHFVGAVHDVQVWRGAATAEEINAIGLQQESYWALDESVGGTDAWSGRDLTFQGEHEWVEDRFGECWAAYGLGLDGTGSAETDSTVMTTDESFTVSAWARIDDRAGAHAVVAQAGQVRSSFYLRYHSTFDRWQFTMPSADATSVSWHTAMSQSAPEVGVWYHLVGVHDLGAGEVRLYVNGDLQDSVAAPTEPWHAAGELLIGASGNASGRWDWMVGAIDQVRVYSGVLDELRIADQGIRPTVPLPPGECDFD